MLLIAGKLQIITSLTCILRYKFLDRRVRIPKYGANMLLYWHQKSHTCPLVVNMSVLKVTDRRTFYSKTSIDYY